MIIIIPKKDKKQVKAVWASFSVLVIFVAISLVAY